MRGSRTYPAIEIMCIIYQIWNITRRNLPVVISHVLRIELINNPYDLMTKYPSEVNNSASWPKGTRKHSEIFQMDRSIREENDCYVYKIIF